jgi:hypothetical protein
MSLKACNFLDKINKRDNKTKKNLVRLYLFLEKQFYYTLFPKVEENFSKYFLT